MCALYGVTRAGFYAWRKRAPSERASEDEDLLERVRAIHRDSRGLYGSPRVTGQLRLDGHCIGRRRVARLMRQAGLQGRSARLYRNSKVKQRAFFASVPHLREGVEPTSSNQVWVGDVTYLRVAGQWRYMAAVMDVHSRRIIGWSLGGRRDAALTKRALMRSSAKRGHTGGVIFHSDRGIEYASYAYRRQVERLGMLQSMNRAGKMNDNAHMESFFHSMKTEELHGKTFATDEQLRQALCSYISFYNNKRLHSSLKYLAPTTFEQREANKRRVN
jgi:transposase InsO family protein